MESVTMTLLYDFYGELLTKKQRVCFNLYYNQDCSLSEIADEVGISRQGVHDSITRAEASLKNYEEKIGCMARAKQNQTALAIIRAAADTLAACEKPEITALAEQILSAADTIKE